MNEVQQKVQIPSIVLMATAGVSILIQCISSIWNLIALISGSAAAFAGGADSPAWMSTAMGWPNVILGLLSLAVGGVIIFGGWKMKELKMYGLAMTASILALIPCISPCCCLTLPAGIWSLVVLMNQDVKAAFQ
jgi:hypothetical protein